MNVTLSADEKLVARAREYARRQDLTLNQLLRNYMQRLTGGPDPQEVAREFEALAREHSGRSDPGFHFDREAAHARGVGQ